MAKNVARYLPVLSAVYIILLGFTVYVNASFLTPSNILDYNGNIFSYDSDNALIKRSLDGHENWKVEGPFQFLSVNASHGVISLLDQDFNLHRFGTRYGDSLLVLDDRVKSFKTYLSYILYRTLDNELVVVDSQTGFEFWRKKFLNSDDYFFYNKKGEVGIKTKNTLAFYSVLTGEKTSVITLPKHQGTFFEFANFLLYLSKNIFYQLKDSGFESIKEFKDSTIISKIDHRYITYKSNSDNKVYVYDIVLKKQLFEREIEDLKFIDVSASKLCLVSKLNIMVFDFNQVPSLLDSPLTFDIDKEEIRSCIVKDKTVVLYSKTEIQRFKLP